MAGSDRISPASCRSPGAWRSQRERAGSPDGRRKGIPSRDRAIQTALRHGRAVALPPSIGLTAPSDLATTEPAMIERLTSSQIEARLGHMIARHPGCRGFHVEVQVRRLVQGLGPHDRWEADFRATGDIGGRATCELALLEILTLARKEFALSLDS